MRQQGRDQDSDPGTVAYTTVKPGDGFYKITAVEPLIAGKGCMGLHRLPSAFERLSYFGIDPPK